MPQPLIQTQQLRPVRERGLTLPLMHQQMSHPSRPELHLMGHQMRPPELTHPKRKRIPQHQTQPESGQGWPPRNYPFRRRLQHLRHRLPRPWRHR